MSFNIRDQLIQLDNVRHSTLPGDAELVLGRIFYNPSQKYTTPGVSSHQRNNLGRLLQGKKQPWAFVVGEVRWKMRMKACA